MFEKPLQQLEEPKSRPEPGEDFSYEEWASSSSLRSLLRSHAELCSVLRSAGRQISRLEGDVNFLSKVRETIRNAEVLRKSWKSPGRPSLAVGPELPQEIYALSPTQTVARKGSRRMTRPRRQRVLKFPQEDSR